MYRLGQGGDTRESTFSKADGMRGAKALGNCNISQAGWGRAAENRSAAECVHGMSRVVTALGPIAARHSAKISQAHDTGAADGREVFDGNAV